MAASNFTKTQRAILNVLADGEPHTRAELAACLDSLSRQTAIHRHLYIVRRILRASGQDILCEWCNHRPRYRRVILYHTQTELS